MSQDIEALLKAHDIRPTAVRILIWRTLLQFDYAFALSDLEGQLPTVDRSTLFRALSLFADSSLLHSIDDGSGERKYCICREDMGEHECHCHEEGKGHHHEQCQHVHLTCVVCGKTYCLPNQHIPMVEIPEGFQVRHISYIIQGVCAHCAHKS